MQKPQNKIHVQVFIDELRNIDSQQCSIFQKLRDIVFAVYPQVKERIIYGGIMFSFGKDIGGIFPYKKHISFEFGNGYKMKDPNGLLEGKGKFRRHLKLASITDIKTKEVLFFVKQMA